MMGKNIVFDLMKFRANRETDTYYMVTLTNVLLMTKVSALKEKR